MVEGGIIVLRNSFSAVIKRRIMKEGESFNEKTNCKLGG